jgi:hypothetical protein
METKPMEFDNSHGNGWQTLLLSWALWVAVWLIKTLHFSFSLFVMQVTDWDWHRVAHTVDIIFHYGLLGMTATFTGIKFYDYMKHRKK